MTLTHDEILSLEIENGTFPTIRIFLKELLRGVLRDGEGFSGKRPFGDSGWEYELYEPLIRTGVVKGQLDEDGYIKTVDTAAADRILLSLVDHVFGVIA